MGHLACASATVRHRHTLRVSDNSHAKVDDRVGIQYQPQGHPRRGRQQSPPKSSIPNEGHAFNRVSSVSGGAATPVVANPVRILLLCGPSMRAGEIQTRSLDAMRLTLNGMNFSDFCGELSTLAVWANASLNSPVVACVVSLFSATTAFDRRVHLFFHYRAWLPHTTSYGRTGSAASRATGDHAAQLRAGRSAPVLCRGRLQLHLYGDEDGAASVFHGCTVCAAVGPRVTPRPTEPPRSLVPQNELVEIAAELDNVRAQQLQLSQATADKAAAAAAAAVGSQKQQLR